MRTYYRCLAVFASILSFTIIQISAQDFDFGNASAIVEYDSLEISVSGKKAELIRFYFHRHQKIRIQDQKGVEAFQKRSLPDNLDPSLITHAPKDRNAGKFLSDVWVDKFDLTITNENGETYKPEYLEDAVPFKSVLLVDDKYGNYFHFDYEFDGLKPGDILDIDYVYSTPYADNLFELITLRIFFNGEFPVIKKDVIFEKAGALEVDVHTYNGEKPVVEEGKSTVYAWHYKNLPGCMAESGARPYKSLPYCIISIKPYGMLYTVPYSFEERFIPFYVFGPLFRESRHLPIVRAMVEGVNTNQYNQLRSFINTQTKGVDDPGGYTQLYKVHNYIANNFSFDGDIDYFNRLDIRNDRLGDYITEEVLRDRSRYDTYVGLIVGLDLDYFTGYISDKRCGIISDNYFEPTLKNDYIFAVPLKDGAVQFLYPKKERFGYFLNELPFYFEDARVRLVCLDDYRNYKAPINDEFRLITTPPSNSADNVRKQSALVKINIDSLCVSLDANISMAGQYSTLGRGAYLYNSCDPSVNPMYCLKLWEGISSVQDPVQFEIENISEDFPYKATIKSSFQSCELISKTADTLELDMSRWFNHVLDTNLNTSGRIMDYYPDFKSTDTYTYKIEFSKKIKVVGSLPNIKVENHYGGFSVRGIQTMDGSIIFTSKFLIAAEKVNAADIQMVAEIQDQIRVLNRYKLRFVVVE